MAVSKKALVNSIPSEDNERGIKNFQRLLDEQLLNIENESTDKGTTDIYEEMLLYMPDTPTGSHVNVHMPEESKSGKDAAQKTALNRLLGEKKTTNSCFSNKMKGYQAIATAISDNLVGIIDWMQGNYQGSYTITIEKEDIDDIINPNGSSGGNLGYGYQRNAEGHIDAFEASTMTVVLHKNETTLDQPLGFNGMGFHVYTAYPGQKAEDGDDIKGVTLLQENVLDTVKETDYYKKASDNEKAFLKLTSSSHNRLPKNTNTYYDKIKDAIVVCMPEFADPKNGIRKQSRYFLTPKPNTTDINVSAKLYTKPMHDNEANYRYNSPLKEPDEYPKANNIINNYTTYIGKVLQNLADIKLKKAQKAELKRIQAAEHIAPRNNIEITNIPQYS